MIPALATFDPTWCPTYATQVVTQPRVRTAQFGDGYSQAEQDGLNSAMRVWTVAWETAPTVNAPPYPTVLQVDAFLRTNAGLRFLWTQPTPLDAEGPRVFRCTDWQWKYDGGNTATLQATFNQCPDT